MSSAPDGTVNVLICGCGPTGAMLSGYLSRMGIENIVIEKEPQITTDPRGIALAKKVGKGRQPPAPQGAGEEQADNDDGGGVADRIDQGACEALVVDRPARGDDRLGAEVGGEHREGDEADAEPAPGQDIVRLAGHPARERCRAA